MTRDEYTAQCAELHAYLVERLGHKWRLETWRDKYRARMKKYGLAACKRAVDGFCTPPGNWYMQEQSHNAPKLIFRSDKALESFLAKAPEPKPEDVFEAAKPPSWAIRERLERKHWKHWDPNARLREKLAPLAGDLNGQSYAAFIEPLLFVRMLGGTVVLYHEAAPWVQEHYREAIERALGCPVEITSEVET